MQAWLVVGLLLAAMPPATAIDAAFFKDCAFVSVDLQEIARSHYTERDMPERYRRKGFALADLNAATDYLYDVALPNAVRVVAACRARHFPIVFVHWGRAREDKLGPDSLWPPGERPARVLGWRQGEYAVAKQGEDAFLSPRLDSILRSHHVHNLIFVGGHTQGCLFHTASSARQRGYGTLCVADATWNCAESTRSLWIEKSSFRYVVTTHDLVKALQGY